MKIDERLGIIETKQKYFEKLIYGIYVLLAVQLGMPLI